MQVSSSLTLSPAERRLSSELSTRQRRERRNMSFLKSNSLRLRAVLLHCIRRRRADDVARPPLVCFTLHPQIQPRWRVLTMRNISLTLLAPLLPLLVVVVLALSASATSPKFQVLHTFVGGAPDGSFPASNLLLDSHGNLFGVSDEGGSLSNCYSLGCGTVFELSPINGRWKERILFNFSPTSSGGFPNVAGTLVLDSRGNVYGTQNGGGDPSCNCGAVYELTRSGGVWTQTILHNFTGGNADGAYPYWGLV